MSPPPFGAARCDFRDRNSGRVFRFRKLDVRFCLWRRFAAWFDRRGGEFSVTINGVQLLAEEFVDDSVIDLGSNFGPNIDLTIVTHGLGDFAVGGAVPEPSTWAMMLLGFAGLGYAGYRRAREPRVT